MSALALATLAAGEASKQPVSGRMLLAVFGVAFIIAMFFTIIKAKAGNNKSPVKLGIIVGSLFGASAVVFTILVIAANRM